MKPEVISSVRDARLPGLDLIRAVAIAWVMIDHAAGFELMPDPHRWYFQFGWIGVDLFFGLSGYLIAGQILKPWSIGLRPDYRKFFQRRLLRTLPGILCSSSYLFSISRFERISEYSAVLAVCYFHGESIFPHKPEGLFACVVSMCGRAILPRVSDNCCIYCQETNARANNSNLHCYCCWRNGC